MRSRPGLLDQSFAVLLVAAEVLGDYLARMDCSVARTGAQVLLVLVLFYIAILGNLTRVAVRLLVTSRIWRRIVVTVRSTTLLNGWWHVVLLWWRSVVAGRWPSIPAAIVASATLREALLWI
jgi:hypothetical protein